jgi:Zn-dependent M16 (insulinase) family peptidase
MVQENAFKLLVDFETTYSPSKVYNWRSERTGLQVVLITKETPMVSGYFAVGSEIDNDSGCPHTLEHLIFMGSQKYPYKGLLDTIGNKMYSVTNAWTDTDQTVYTLETAGWEGFRELLPVYLDHLFHPTLTDSSCLTEVYHIDGKAEEKGVVFAEMQGTENDCESLVMLQSRKLLFGDKSPFATETGGIMSALRVLTNDQIRQFHDLRYRPDNVCIIVTGAVDPDGLIGVMNEFDNLLRVNPSPRRPFVDVPATGHKLRSVREFVDFPDSQERSGEVQLSWIGPNSNDDVVLNMALDILGSYLSREGDGKLQISMVDRKRPSATDFY